MGSARINAVRQRLAYTGGTKYDEQLTNLQKDFEGMRDEVLTKRHGTDKGMLSLPSHNEFGNLCTDEATCGATSSVLFKKLGLDRGKSNVGFKNVKIEGGVYSGPGTEFSGAAVDTTDYKKRKSGEPLSAEVGHEWIKLEDGTIVDGSAGQFMNQDAGFDEAGRYKGREHRQNQRLRIIRPNDPLYKDYKGRYERDRVSGKQKWYNPKDPLKKTIFTGKSARIQTARQRLADIFDVIEGGGKIKPTKFLTPRGEASSVGHSFKTKTTPENYLDLTHAGWSATDDFSTTNLRPQGKKGLHKPSGWGEKGKEIFRGDERGSVEFIRRKIRRGDPIVHPSLNVFSPGETRTKAEAQDIVAGHAGRHRARALHEEGVEEIPVSVFSTRKDKDLVPTKLPTTPEDRGLDIGWYSEGQKTIDEMGLGPRPVSARMQMARERLGGIKLPNLIEKRLIDYTGTTTKLSGKHFITSKGEITRPLSWHRTTLEGSGIAPHVIGKRGMEGFLQKNNVVRIDIGKDYRATGGEGPWLEIEAEHKLTPQQSNIINSHIKKNKLKQTDVMLKDKSTQVKKQLPKGFGLSNEELVNLERQEEQRRTHTQNLAGKLKQRIAVIRVNPTTKRIKRVKKVLDYEYPYQGPEMPTTKHPKTNIPKLTGPRTTTGEERRRKVTKKEEKALKKYISKGTKIRPKKRKRNV